MRGRSGLLAANPAVPTKAIVAITPGWPFALTGRYFVFAESREGTDI